MKCYIPGCGRDAVAEVKPDGSWKPVCAHHCKMAELALYDTRELLDDDEGRGRE